MSIFSSVFWDVFIIVITLGGILAMFLLTYRVSTGKVPESAIEGQGHVWDEDLRELNNPLPRWWVNLFYITIVIGLIYLALYPGLGSFKMLLGWTEVKEYQDEMGAAERKYGPIFEQYRQQDLRKVAADPKAIAIGERLYASYCTVCHGSDARGVRGFPNLRDHDWLWGGKPETIERTILDGRDAWMPAWKDPLGGEQRVKEVAQYVLSLSGRQVDATMASAGKKIFEGTCTGCHGVDGKGTKQYGAPNLTDGTWLYGGSPGIVEQSIANGRRGHMPPHRTFLGEAKVHLLAAYIYSLSAK